MIELGRILLPVQHTWLYSRGKVKPFACHSGRRCRFEFVDKLFYVQHALYLTIVD